MDSTTTLGTLFWPIRLQFRNTRWCHDSRRLWYELGIKDQRVSCVIYSHADQMGNIYSKRDRIHVSRVYLATTISEISSSSGLQPQPWRFSSRFLASKSSNSQHDLPITNTSPEIYITTLDIFPESGRATFNPFFH